MLTAFMLIPILGIVGLAVDYSTTSLKHSQLKSQADAAALFGAKRAQRILNEGSGDLTQLKQDVRDYFLRGAEGIPQLQPRIRIEETSSAVTVKVDWTANPNSIFGNLFQKDSYQISGLGEATIGLERYVKIYVVVDVSQSMGIGASPNDQIRLFDRTGCMFACHLPNPPQRRTTYDIARQINVQTRVDVARDALIESVKEVRSANRGGHNRIRMGVYTFSNSVETLVDVDGPDSSDMDRIATTVRNNLVLGRDGGGSDFKSLEAFLSSLPEGGNGGSAETPKVSVILISDGMANSQLSRAGAGGRSWGADPDNHNLPLDEVGAILDPRTSVVLNRSYSLIHIDSEKQVDAGQMGVMDKRVCDAAKAKSITMMVAAARYVVPEARYSIKSNGKEDLRFRWILQNGVLDGIRREMEACASPGMFVMTDDGQSLHNAVVHLLAESMKGTLRLAR